MDQGELDGLFQLKQSADPSEAKPGSFVSGNLARPPVFLAVVFPGAMPPAMPLSMPLVMTLVGAHRLLFPPLLDPRISAIDDRKEDPGTDSRQDADDNYHEDETEGPPVALERRGCFEDDVRGDVSLEVGRVGGAFDNCRDGDLHAA